MKLKKKRTKNALGIKIFSLGLPKLTGFTQAGTEEIG